MPETRVPPANARAVPPSVFEPVDPESIPAVQEMLDAIKAAEEPLALQEARRHEDATMRAAYPGEYVAYTESAADARRTVLAHDRSLKVVHDALAHLTEAQINVVRVTYCDAPSQATAFRAGANRPRLPEACDTRPGA
jgi:hypothetical protein